MQDESPEGKCQDQKANHSVFQNKLTFIIILNLIKCEAFYCYMNSFLLMRRNGNKGDFFLI